MAVMDTLKNGITALRPFLPAQDFAKSHAFYTALGFEPHDYGPTMTSFKLGRFGFLLQGFYVKEWAENFMMHLLVEDLDSWWAHIESLNLQEAFGVPAPRAPKLEPWDLRVAYVFDPSGVLWHVAGEVPPAPVVTA